MIESRVIVDDKGAELRALQLLALALDDAAARLSRQSSDKPSWAVAGPLLMAAARALSLASCAGLDTPLEVVALSARNAFEIWLRLTHIVATDANSQSWRDEALTDQLEVYEAILALDGPDEPKAVVRAEIERVKQHGAARRLNERQKRTRIADLAKATGHKTEYDAFYKLYSKLVHPSSWSVNWPGAVSSAMYRATLSANVQMYGWCILKLIEDEFGVSADESYQTAVARLPEGRLPLLH